MLTQSDIDRERYEARQKAQRDHNSSMNFARSEGLKQGQEIGQKIGEAVGRIHAYEAILQRTETPKEQLVVLSDDDLMRLVDDLRNQVLKSR